MEEVRCHIGAIPPSETPHPRADLGWIATSHTSGGAGWWKSPSPDLGRARGGRLPRATRRSRAGRSGGAPWVDLGAVHELHPSDAYLGFVEGVEDDVVLKVLRPVAIAQLVKRFAARGDFRKFSDAMLQGKPIKVFNNGEMLRDFTYIDDIVEGVVRVLDKPATANPDWQGATPDPGTSPAPYRLFNIGNNNPVELNEFIEIIETCLGRKAIKEFQDIQPGDVKATFADIDDLINDVGFKPSTPLKTGIERFIRWYKEYYNIK